jgi:hypothetical protein
VGFGIQRQRQTKDNVLREAPEKWKFEKRRRPQSKRYNGIKDRGLKQQLRLGSEENIYETLNQTIVLKIVKLASGSSIEIRKMSVKIMWRGRPPPKQKKRPPAA